jgi:PadR family transcriptional regulator PadR
MGPRARPRRRASDPGKIRRVLNIEAGSLYPALHRLERQGLITAEWKTSENNQRAKYYSLTAAGRKELVAEESKWDLLVKAVTRVRKPASS